MREIKFRAWDEMKKYMVNIGKLHLGKKLMVEHDKSEWDWYQKEVPIMQYTGLKDKNGVEIYEGDILDVESERYPFVENRTGVVKTVDGSWVIEDLEGTDGEYLFNETLEVKIIGNIHEHKHLLEGESIAATNE